MRTGPHPAGVNYKDGDSFTVEATLPAWSSTVAHAAHSTSLRQSSVSTVLARPTVVKTSFHTVRVSGTGVIPASRNSSSCNSTSRLRSNTAPLPTGTGHAITRRSSSASAQSLSSAPTEPTIPTVVTSASSTRSGGPAPTISNTSTSSDSTHHIARKHAVIGGLCGAIAGLILSGIIIAWILRRRKSRRSVYANDIDKVVGSEPSVDKLMDILHPRPAAPRPTILPVSAITAAHLHPQKPLPLPPKPTEPRTVGTATTDTGSSYRSMLESHMIKVPLTHWPHFFAPGEGIRDSIRPGRLRVTNPDVLRTYSVESIPQQLAPDSRLQTCGIRQVMSREGAEGHQSVIASLHNIASTDSGTSHASDSPSSDAASQRLPALPSSLSIRHPTAATVLLARTNESPPNSTSAPRSTQVNALPSTTVLTPPTPTAPHHDMPSQADLQPSASPQQRPETPLDPLRDVCQSNTRDYLQPPAPTFDRHNPTSARSSITSSQTRISSTPSDPFDLDTGRSVDMSAVSPMTEHGHAAKRRSVDDDTPHSGTRSSVGDVMSNISRRTSTTSVTAAAQTPRSNGVDDGLWRSQWRRDVGLYEGT